MDTEFPRPGVPSLWDLMSVDLSWDWCSNNRNKVHNKCNALESSQNHNPPPGLWENSLPRNWSLVPKRLGTTGLDHVGCFSWSWREMARMNSQIPESRGGPPTCHLIFILATSFLLGNLRPRSFSRQPPWTLGLCKAHSQHLSLLSCSWLVKSHLLHTILFRVIHFLT